MKEWIIGTRGSDLALWQARFLQAQLNSLGIQSTLKIIKTQGDILEDLTFDKIEGKGFFTKELETALLREEIDLAVHSMKDLPTSHANQLIIAGISERATPNDVLLIRKTVVSSEMPLKLPQSPVVGTSSIRRKVQLKGFRSDAILNDIRGNVPTRIKKLQSGEFDAIILAAAGLERLQINLDGLEVINFHPREFVPAPAQGILAYQCHTENIEIRKILNRIHHTETAKCSNVERTVLKMADGGCHLPLGVYCEKDNMGHFHCSAVYARSIHDPVIRVFVSRSTTFGLAEEVFRQLCSKSDIKI
ncbi:MAG TPA: hydroxymethylbilane synthase [Saprospiraceae bacterium]|nr:hydroxymethylbilane synthase [Saprospiraceae bacterium]